MAEVKAFKGYRFTLSDINGLGPLCAPPYDMIDETMIDKLYGKHQNNVVRITQNRREPSDTANKDRHVRAAKFLSDWINAEIIKRDENDSVYIYRQQFTIDQNGVSKNFERIGICLLVKLVDFEEKIVLPHEYTLSGPKQDRYELMETTNANTGQIFGLATDDNGAMYALIRKIMESTSPAGVFTDDNGVTHTIHRCDDSALISKAVELMKTRNILIADGHHRYETALRFYGNHGNNEAFSHVMMTLVSTADPGLVIRPFHRLVRKSDLGRSVSDMKGELSKYFDVAHLGKASTQGIIDALSQPASSPSSPEMVFWDNRTMDLYGLRLNGGGEEFLKGTMPERSAGWKRLDVSKINCIIISGILQLPLDGHVLHDIVNYVNDAGDGAKRLSECADEFYGGFFIRPVSIGTINDIVKGGERMPQKSTNFFPKLYSGLVFNKMD